MAYTKAEAFSAEDRQLAMLAKALAHPARIAILRLLAQRGTCVCSQVVEGLPLSQATVSQHLKELKQAGLVQGEIDGPRVCYCLHKEGLKAAGAALAALFNVLLPNSPEPGEPLCCATGASTC